MKFERAPFEAAKTEIAPIPEKRELSPELKRAADFYRAMLFSEDMSVNLQSETVIKKLEESGSRNISEDIAAANARISRKKKEGSWGEANPLSELFENMIVVEGEQAGLFGPDARVVRLGVFDDVKRGADVMLELPVNPDSSGSLEGEDVAHIIIDLTVAESVKTLSEKLERIKRNPLNSVKHYVSPTTNVGMRIENVPHVILNIPGENLSRFIKMSGMALFFPEASSAKRYKAAESRKKILETNPATRGLLDTIDAQLTIQAIFEIKIISEKLLEEAFSENSAAIKEAAAAVVASGIKIGDPFSSGQRERDGYFSSVAGFLKLADEKGFSMDQSSELLLSRLLDSHVAVSRAISRKAADRAAMGLPADNNRPIISPSFERAFAEEFV